MTPKIDVDVGELGNGWMTMSAGYGDGGRVDGALLHNDRVANPRCRPQP